MLYLFQNHYHAPYESNTRALLTWDKVTEAMNKFPCQVCRFYEHVLQQTTPEGLYMYIYHPSPAIFRCSVRGLLSNLEFYYIPYLDILIFNYGSVAVEPEQRTYLSAPYFTRTYVRPDDYLRVCYKHMDSGPDLVPYQKEWYYGSLQSLHVEFPEPRAFPEKVYNSELNKHAPVDTLTPAYPVTARTRHLKDIWNMPPIYCQNLTPITQDLAMDLSPVMDNEPLHL